MSKLIYMFAILMLSVGAYSYADEATCPEGQTMDPNLGVCVDTPVTPDEPAAPAAGS